MWQRKFEVFGRVVEILNTSNIIDATLDALTNCYKPSSAIARFCYRIEKSQHGWTLTMNDRPIFTASQIEDIPPTLEMQLYNEIHHDLDEIVFHAGAISTASGAIMLCGESEAGKSTLVMSLIKAGYLYLSDEWIKIDAHHLATGWARPLCFSSLYRSTINDNDHAFKYQVRNQSGDIVSGLLVSPSKTMINYDKIPVTAIVSVVRAPGRKSTLRQLPSHLALEKLWRNVFNPNPELADNFIRLVSSTRVFELVNGDLPTAVAHLENLAKKPEDDHAKKLTAESLQY
jgi:hypothetical protein